MMLADGSNDDSIARAVSQLTALLDSRDFSQVTPSPALLASLMSLLSLVLARRQSIKEGLDYLEQEILSALVALLVRINDPQDITRAHIGIEVVIKVIRASGNPRTAQRALLVAGELARLVPEAVLHNIMPIFTFMGSSDLQRDDAYSFGVVEKVSH
jgi:U3 small nucleolar RNA-associated protein 10